MISSRVAGDAGQKIGRPPVEEGGRDERNPRRTFGESQLRGLAGNILILGVLQPIVVRPAPDGAEGMYELVARRPIRQVLPLRIPPIHNRGIGTSLIIRSP